MKEFLPDGSTIATEQSFLATRRTGIAASELPDGTMNVLLPSPERETIRADITYKYPGETDPYLIDVTVCDPSAPSYLRLYKSHEHPGGHTATQREHQKSNQYALRVPEITADDRFVPFGIEVTGHLGTTATNFLRAILNPTNPESDSKLRRIQGRLTIALMKWNVAKIAVGRREIKKVSQSHSLINHSISNILQTTTFLG